MSPIYFFVTKTQENNEIVVPNSVMASQAILKVIVGNEAMPRFEQGSDLAGQEMYGGVREQETYG
jgi:hypothetical protein